MGSETTSNIFKAVRADGVIVKPDVPIVPTDRSYLADARQETAPLVASTHTRHGETRTEYLFAFNRPKDPSSEVFFRPADFGFSGPVYVHDYFAESGRRFDATAAFSARLKRGTNCFYVIAPVSRSGIALLGDKDKFVGTGKQRIATIDDQGEKLALSVIFAEGEKSVTLHGYAAAAPHLAMQGGRAGDMQYNPATQYFSVEIKPDTGAPLDRSTADSVRRASVVLECARK